MSFDFTGLLKLFYRSGLPYLPVLSSGLAEGSPAAAREAAGSPTLAGFVSRRLLDRQAVDLDRIQETHTRLPESLLVTDHIPGDLIGALGQAEAIPLLDMSGREIRAWTSSEFLAALSAYKTRLQERVAAESGDVAEDDDGQSRTASRTGRPAPAAGSGDWLSRMVLGGFPHPLFASDLQGKTLFYNEAFEAAVLAQPALKNSLRLAESYFLELTRELLARSLQQGPDRGVPLRTRLPDMHLALEIATLERDGRVMGYLYIFRDLVWTGLQYELQDMLGSGLGLDDIIDEIESALIYSALKDQGQNISHTAQMLKVKRSTLQNKMKRLKIDEKYDRRVEGPIRRKRRGAGGVEVRDVPPVELSDVAARAVTPAKKTPGAAAKSRSGKTLARKKARKKPAKASPKSKTVSKKSSARSSGGKSGAASKAGKKKRK